MSYLEIQRPERTLLKFTAYKAGPGIKPEPITIEAYSVQSAKLQATKLLDVKHGTWAKTDFKDFEDTARTGWTKGLSGWDYGSYPRICMYQIGGV